MRNPFRYFNSSPEVIRLVVMMYIRYPLSLRQVEDILFERGIDICHETIRFWWNRFGPMFAAAIRKRRRSASFKQLMQEIPPFWPFLISGGPVNCYQRCASGFLNLEA